MSDPFKSTAPVNKIWNPINPYEPSICNKIPEPVPSASSPLAMLAEQVRRKRSESSRISPTLENSGVSRVKNESQTFPSHPSIMAAMEVGECALDLSTKNAKLQELPKSSSEPPDPAILTEGNGIIGSVFSLAELHSDSDQFDMSFNDNTTKLCTELEKPPLSPTSNEEQSESLAMLPKSDEVEKIIVSSPPESFELEKIAVSSPPESDGLEKITVSSPPESEELEKIAVSSPPESEELEKIAVSSPPESEELEKIAVSSLPESEEMKETCPGSPLKSQVKRKPFMASPKRDAVKRKPLMASPKLDSAKRKSLMASPKLDSAKRKSLMASPKLDSTKRKSLMASPKLDAVKKKSLMASPKLDSSKRKSLMASPKLDSTKRKSLMASPKLESAKRKSLMASPKLDAAKRKSLMASPKLDSAKRKSLMASPKLDAVKRKSFMTYMKLDEPKRKLPMTPPKSDMSSPVSNLRSSPLYKKRKLIPKSPLATARRLKLNPDLSQSTPTPSSMPSKSSTSEQKTPPVVNNKHTGRTVRRMPTGEALRWLKRTIALPLHNNKKRSYMLIKKCTPCCVVLSKLPLEANQKSLNLTSCSDKFSDIFANCTRVCWKEYGKMHNPWINALHRRMKRLFALLLWGQTPKFVSIRMEPLVKAPKPPKSQPRRGPSLQSATPGKRRFFLLELKRKTILIPVVGNKMEERAFELDNPKNIGILYNIAASLQKSSGDE